MLLRAMIADALHADRDDIELVELGLDAQAAVSLRATNVRLR